ncbi:HigA family addiction module antitoxin [Methylococcus sp. ANG]|uniref:HigA family addiction module antitoxin n=2 Tax=unclassified Methylococcus TaxID=2618889 RepID=UPI003459157A
MFHTATLKQTPQYLEELFCSNALRTTLKAKTQFWSITRTITERGATMAMHNPPHPGAILKEDVLPELGLSVTEAARQLGVSRVALSRVLHGKAAISADMALRLEAWINGPTAETWVRMQADYDLWQARQRPAPKVQRVAA